MGGHDVGVAVFGSDSPPPNLKDLVPRIAPRPVFLIYADRGQGGEKLSADYYEAAGEPKQLWKTDSGHTGGYDAVPGVRAPGRAVLRRGVALEQPLHRVHLVVERLVGPVATLVEL